MDRPSTDDPRVLHHNRQRLASGVVHGLCRDAVARQVHLGRGGLCRALLRSLGLAYSQLEIDHQCILPVVEATCRYKSPARYDDRLVIETRPSLLRGSVIKFAYRILREASHEGEKRTLLAEGETTHVVCDSQMNKKHLPENYAAALRAILEQPQKE